MGLNEGILFLVPIACFVLAIIALVDLISHKATSNKKLLWALLILFIPVLGPVMYLLSKRSIAN